MRIKIAKLIADFLAERGVTHVFGVTGGGAMHLNDALGHHAALTCIYNHHEQASAMAAEGYARMSGRVAAVCVTSGPGGTNAITGVLGAYLDSIPMFVVSGQVKRETTTWACELPLRQLGDQEYNIVASVTPMTKYAQMLTEPRDVLYHLEKAWYLCTHGRQGPVWLDIPLDVQAAEVEFSEMTRFDASECAGEEPVYDATRTEAVLARVREARRPVILAGTGVRRSGAVNELLAFAEKLEVPLLTAWNAHDLVPDAHPLFCGRPGTVGTRGGNFVIQQADLLLVLGCRLNIRQIGYNWRAFAPEAYKIVVDIDRNELKKPTVRVDMPIHADVRDALTAWLAVPYTKRTRHAHFLAWAREINEQYPVVPAHTADRPLDPYVFLQALTARLGEGARMVCGNGAACVMTFQAAEIKKGQRLFTNSGCAAMGYGLPAAIGACFSAGGGRVICIDGDGSIQMNLQELQTVVHHGLDLKIVVLNNNGYHSIRQTQRNLFSGTLVGVCEGNGISFPDMERIAYGYGIPFCRVRSASEMGAQLSHVLGSKGPFLCEVVVDETRGFEPKVTARVLEDGSIVSPPLDDMYPFLPREEYKAARYAE